MTEDPHPPWCICPDCCAGREMIRRAVTGTTAGERDAMQRGLDQAWSALEADGWRWPC